MKQMLPSALHLSQAKVLSQGNLDLFAALRKLLDLATEQISIDTLPENSIDIQWSEVHSPRMKAAFADGLIANRLYSKNFQFFAKFANAGESIESKDWQNTPNNSIGEQDGEVENYGEYFSTCTPDGMVLYEKFASGNLLNCTWLLEFLITPQACIQAGEYLLAKYIDNAFVIELQANSGNYREIEQYIFNLDFTAVKWQHDTIFNRK